MKKTTSYRKNQQNSSLFEQESTVQSLSEMGNPLEFISGIVDFELFRPTLEAHLLNEERKSNAGRRPIDPVLMFKVMFLQRLYGLSDEQAEYQIKDRTSFREFLGILTVTDVPDARTIWKYRETLSKSGGYDAMFRDFYNHLATLGLIVHEGKMIDASFVVSPPPAQHPGRKRRHKGWQRRRALGRQAQQEAPQGHGCKMDKEARRDILRL